MCISIDSNGISRYDIIIKYLEKVTKRMGEEL